MGIRIFVVDDHPLFRDALKIALAQEQGRYIFEEAENFSGLADRLARQGDIELVLLDLRMPGVQGLSGLAFMRAQYPQIPVAVVSGVEEPRVVQGALSLGAAGFIAKSTTAENIRHAVESILAGEIWVSEGLINGSDQDPARDDIARRLTTLTPQQMRVLMMVREGKLNKQIAFELEVSEATIKAHVSAILQKLNVDSRTQAVIAASKLDGIVTELSEHAKAE